jgi:hypothetical protein
MRELAIIGAGGFGKEPLQWAHQSKLTGRTPAILHGNGQTPMGWIYTM